MATAKATAKTRVDQATTAATTSNKQKRKTSIQFGEDNELEKSFVRTAEKAESKNHVCVSVSVSISVS